MDPITGLSLSSLPLSQVSTESDLSEHQQHTFSTDLPIPSQFQQQLVIDPPSNALFNDPDAPQDGDHSHHTGESQAHNSLEHHGHHKHKDHALEHYHLPDDVLLKISPRGHSSGPVIISQVGVYGASVHTYSVNQKTSSKPIVKNIGVYMTDYLNIPISDTCKVFPISRSPFVSEGTNA